MKDGRKAGLEIPEFTLDDWLPTSPLVGPPLPRFLGITWPWYEEEPPIEYACPICGATFATEEELSYHVQAVHPEAPPGAEFKVSNLVVSPTEVQVGFPVSISCLITNIGGQAGSYTVALGGEFVAEQSVYLAAGESKAVSFDVTPTAAKTYSVSVDGLHGSFVATTVPVADIRVENLTITPSEVYVGEKVTISVTAKNYGAAAGSKKIICTVT